MRSAAAHVRVCKSDASGAARFLLLIMLSLLIRFCAYMRGGDPYYALCCALCYVTARLRDADADMMPCRRCYLLRLLIR